MEADNNVYISDVWFANETMSKISVKRYFQTNRGVPIHVRKHACAYNLTLQGFLVTVKQSYIL